MSGFEILSIISIGVLSFLLFLALFEPTLPYKVSEPPSAALDSETFLKTLAVLSDSEIRRGSSVEVLANGEVFYESVLNALRQARRSINIEAYIFQPGKVTDQIIEVLVERARAGVRVNLVMDAIGSFRFMLTGIEELEEAGGEVHIYHGFRWNELPRLNSRTHREIVVVDCKVGFVGGPGFADHWLYDKRDKRRWRDTMFRIEGDSVAALQATFVENYLEASGELLTGDCYFCFDTKLTDSAVLVVDSSVSTGQSTRARMLFQTLFAAAQKEILIATPYFLPDKGVRKEIERAIVERDVRVRIICPGQHTDHYMTRHSSRRLWGSLLKAGVEIFEYQPTMMHAKILIVDSSWAVFGSTNLDHRSFSINDELNVATNDPGVICQLKEDFARDLVESKAVRYAEWRRRSLYERAYEGFGRLLERQQ